jgi:hypothetical protein
LLLISQAAGLLPYCLFGILVARADEFTGAHAARDPTLGVKGERVEFEALFRIAGSGGIGDVVLCSFEHTAVDLQGSGGGDERSEQIRHRFYP